MIRQTILSLLALSVVLLFASPTVAEEITEREVQEAQTAFDTGAEHFINENYGRAIVEFSKAHEIYPHPVFLHNIALANKRLGRMERALEAAIRAEEMDMEMPPNTAVRNTGIIAGANVVLEARSIANSIGRTLPQASDTVEPVTPPETPADGGLGVLGYAGIGTVAVGLVGLGVAAYYDRQILNETSGEEPLPADKIAELESMQTTGKIFLFTGAGLTALGATLLVVDLVGGSSDRPVAFGPSLDRPGVQVQGRW